MKFRTEVLRGKWLPVHTSSNENILEMLGNTLQKAGIPWDINANMPGDALLNKLGLSPLSLQAGVHVDDRFSLVVPERYFDKAMNLIKLIENK